MEIKGMCENKSKVKLMRKMRKREEQSETCQEEETNSSA